MTTEVKKIIGAKLNEAITFEGLEKTAVGKMLGLKSRYYINMITSGQVLQHSKISKEAWERVRDWTNSGETIKEYSRKQGLYAEYPPKKKANEIPPPPHIPPPPPLDAKDALVKRLGDELKVRDSDIKRLNAQNSALEDSIKGWIQKYDDYKREYFYKEETSEIRKVERMDLDRLQVCLEAINNLKEMGFLINIHISNENQD